MDVNKVLKRLVKYDKSLPAIKLAWNCELGLQNCDYIPKVSPSHYKKEILLSTNERYSLLCNQQKKFELHKSGFEIIAIPSILVFQNCTIGQKSSTKLSLRNVGKISQKATFFMGESYGFSIDENSQKVAKFAPGMTVTITVNFIPEDDRDHYHKLIISTKDSRFAIPIIAIGSRGIIDIPDMFDFGDVPVRVLKKQLVVGYNSGTQAARFTLTTDGHFSVKPERGIVAPKDAFSFEISFIAEYVQQYEGFVLIKYDNDEEVHSICKANAVEANIYVCPEGFTFEDTYLGLKSRSTISIVNDSDEILDFKWIQRIASATSTDSDNKDQIHHKGDGDFREWNNQGSRGENKNRISLDKHYMTTEVGDAFYHENFLIEPLLGKIQPHTTIDVQAIFEPTNHFFYDRDAYLNITGLQDPIVVNVRGKGKGSEFKFNFDELDLGVVFVGGNHEYEVALTNIGQIEGTIKFDEVVDSMGDIELSVKPEKMTLAPDQCGAFYVSVSCGGEPCDIFERLKFTVTKSGHAHLITIKGVSGFPRMHFSTSEMYFGNVGYGFPFSQQVLLINDSLNTIMVYLEIEDDGTEPPVDYIQLIEMYKTKRLDQPASDDESIYKEFTIEPPNFILNPRGFQLITVTICGHGCRNIQNTLLGRIISNGGSKTKPILSLPIQARCTTPTLMNGDPDLFIDDAFLHYPNEAVLKIRNSSPIPGCYYIVPVASDQYACGSPRYIGVANANSTTEVPITIIAQRTGKSAAYFDVYALGKKSRLLSMMVKYEAAAAKLTVDSKKIDFGEINVLVPSVQEIDIVNDSPLTIPFWIKLLDGGKNGEQWTTNPERGSMDADSKTKIRFSVVLKEIGVHNALTRVQMQDAVNSIDIKLTAIGKGTSLTFDPPWMTSHQLNFGYMFTKASETFTVEVTNNGHLAKCIEWINLKSDPPQDPTLHKFDRRINSGNSSDSKPKATGQNADSKSKTEKGPIPKLKETVKNPKNVKAGRNSSTEKGMESNKGQRKSLTVTKPINRKENFIFTIVPQKKVLQPKTSVTMHFTAHSMTPNSMSEAYNLWCYSLKPPKDDSSRLQPAAVPRQSRGDINDGQTPYQESLKPMISHTVNMTVNFEIPKLRCSKSSVMFRIDAFPLQNDFLQEDTVKIENPGVLPITATFETKFPFSIQTKHMGAMGLEIEDLSEYAYTFKSKEQISLTLKFDGQHLRKDRGTYNFDSELHITYLGHPEFTTVKLHGEVNFPQVILDRDEFDLGAIENGGEIVEEFTLTNPCNFCLTYKWFIKPRSTFIEYEPGELEQTCLKKNCEETLQSDAIVKPTHSRYHKKEIKKHDSKLLLPDNEAQLKNTGDENNDRLPERKDVNTHEINTVQMNSLLVSQNHTNPHKNSMAYQTYLRSKRGEHSHRRKHKKTKALKKPLSGSKKRKKSTTASNELDRYGDWVQFVRNKYFRSRMMEVMGLHDSAKEKEDETNYLHHHPFEPKTINNFAISQLLDIVPLAGIIQAGQTQSFMLVFYGHSNVKLKTTAICYIEGGASKPIVITAQSKFVDNRDSAISFQVESMLSNTNSVLKTMKVLSKKTVDNEQKKKEVVPITENEEEEEEPEIIDKFKHRCAQRLLLVAAPPVKLSKPKSKKKPKKSSGLTK